MEYCDKIQELEQRIQVLEDNLNFETQHDINGFDPEFWKAMNSLNTNSLIYDNMLENSKHKQDIKDKQKEIKEKAREVCIKEYGRISEAVKHIPFGYIALRYSSEDDEYRWRWSLTKPTNIPDSACYKGFTIGGVDSYTYQKILDLITKFNLHKFYSWMINLRFKDDHLDPGSEYTFCFKCGGY